MTRSPRLKQLVSLILLAVSKVTRAQDLGAELAGPLGDAESTTAPASGPFDAVDEFGMPEELSIEPLWDTGWDLPVRPSGCSLDILGGYQNGGTTEGFYGFALLTIPWSGCRAAQVASIAPPQPSERIVRTAARAPEEQPMADESSRTDEQPTGPVASTEPLVVSEARAPAPARTTRSPAWMADFRARVLAGTGAGNLEQRLDSLAARERLQGLLPELRLRGSYGLDQSTSLEAVGTLAGETTSRGGYDTGIEARLTFHLERLLVGQSELGAARLRQSLLEERLRALEQALDELGELDEAEGLLRLPDLADEERVKLEVRAELARMRLHLRTGGWFPLAASP